MNIASWSGTPDAFALPAHMTTRQPSQTYGSARKVKGGEKTVERSTKAFDGSAAMFSEV
jgi:hypothetical protein